MKIIKATRNEISDIVSLNTFVQEIHHREFPDLFKPANTSQEIHRFFESIINVNNNHIFVAYQGQTPIGYAWVMLMNRPESPLKYARKLAYLHHITVHEKHRRQNIGKALFGEVEKLAEQEGIEHFELDTWSFNTDAKEFFQKLGFEPYNIRMWRRNQ